MQSTPAIGSSRRIRNEFRNVLRVGGTSLLDVHGSFHAGSVMSALWVGMGIGIWLGFIFGYVLCAKMQAARDRTIIIPNNPERWRNER